MSTTAQSVIALLDLTLLSCFMICSHVFVFFFFQYRQVSLRVGLTGVFVSAVRYDTAVPWSSNLMMLNLDLELFITTSILSGEECQP